MSQDTMSQDRAVRKRSTTVSAVVDLRDIVHDVPVDNGRDTSGGCSDQALRSSRFCVDWAPPDC